MLLNFLGLEHQGHTGAQDGGFSADFSKIRKKSKRCHSERSEESLLVSSRYLDRREILRFAQNDRPRDV
jgi:hypothetical protein